MNARALCSVGAAVVATNLAFGIYFLLRGAWPVAPFMGLEAILLACAFQASHRAASRGERLWLTPEALRVDRHPARGSPICFEFNPYRVRVAYEERLGGGGRLALASHGRSVRVGTYLPLARNRSVAQSPGIALEKLRQTHFG